MAKNIIGHTIQENNGRTPLHEAAENGHIPLVEFFLHNLEDKSPKDLEGKIPLQIAIDRKHFKICNLIVEAENSGNLKSPLDPENLLNDLLTLDPNDLMHPMLNGIDPKNLDPVTQPIKMDPQMMAANAESQTLAEIKPRFV